MNGTRQSTPSEARLRHDVVLFGHGKCCVTEKVLSTSHVNRIMYGPKGCRRVPETMQIDGESEGFPGSLSHGEIKGITPHWDAVM
jgi:hypothetical protein